MPGIFTVTLNTALDYLIELEEFVPGSLHESAAASLTPAGKGINAARTLASLGEAVSVAGFIGNDNRGAFESLGFANIRQGFIPVPGQTRINVTLHERDLHRTTHIRNSGYRVQEEHLDLLMQQLEDWISEGDYIILTGSLPPGAPENLYAELIRLVHARRGTAILDTSGAALQAGITAHPDIIVPNLSEFITIAERDLKTDEEIIDAAAVAAETYSIDHVVISLAAQGLIAVELEHRRYHRIKLKNPVSDPIVSDVGCGDALVGGLVYGLVRGESMSDVLRFGAASGTANLFKKIPGLVDPDQLNTYRELYECNTFRYSN